MDGDFVLKNSLRNEQVRKLAIEFHRKTVANPLRKERHDRDMLHVGKHTASAPKGKKSLHTSSKKEQERLGEGVARFGCDDVMVGLADAVKNGGWRKTVE